VASSDSTSLIECSVNGDYYAEQRLPPDHRRRRPGLLHQPELLGRQHGPHYSSLGGAQAAVRAGAENKIVVVSPNQPGFDLINSGVVEYAESEDMEGQSILEDVPISDPAGLAQRLVQEAGEGGAVVLDFTGPAVLPLLQAIDQQGLVDTVIWASSTPPNDPSVASELSSAWNGKFLINAEFNVLDSGKPDQNHMNEIRQKYRSDIPSSSFAQMGYLAGRVATEGLLSIEGDITAESVNEAFLGVTNCERHPLRAVYYDSTTGSNVSNNVDLTVAPEDGNMVQVEDCFKITDLPATARRDPRGRGGERSEHRLRRRPRQGRHVAPTRGPADRALRRAPPRGICCWSQLNSWASQPR
jgi:branched-chain amino acid transport system substrate-binding protein